ncbi:MAG: phosphoglycerate dehydrogenase [Candidatus Eremiobacteraeota bacterium]|nr:phosphoglycerate dehydrogenase [Candidatus Eremiobacteraeota bacterium]
MEKIVITTTTFGEYDETPLELLSGFEVIKNPYRRKLSSVEAVELARDAVGILAGTEKLDAKAITSLPKLKVISRVGTGLDSVDCTAAERCGIRVFNTPDAPTLAVAELTVALMLNLMRKISFMDRRLREGKWEKCMGNLLYGRNVGIVGFGKIGKKVAELLMAFGCKISYADPCVDDEKACTCLPLEEVLASSDIVTLHADSKERILGEKELRLMKAGALLLNLSRGEAVNYGALAALLKEGHLAGAALDVFPDEPYTGPLKELEQVILTPHIGSYAMECRVQMEIAAVKNLLEGLGARKKVKP